jgi:hypothetical protein
MRLTAATMSMETDVVWPWRENLAVAKTECHFVYPNPCSGCSGVLERITDSSEDIVRFLVNYKTNVIV